MNEDYQKQLELEKKTYEENKKTKLALAAAKHQESIKLKRRLERMLPDYNAYRATIKEKRSEEFETREREARAALEAEKQRRRAAYEQYLEEERRAEEERQREEEAERERLHKEEEERIAKEEAARKEAAERTRIREEERRYVLTSVLLLIDPGNKMRSWKNKDSVRRRLRRILLVVEHNSSKVRRLLPHLV